MLIDDRVLVTKVTVQQKQASCFPFHALNTSKLTWQEIQLLYLPKCMSYIFTSTCKMNTCAPVYTCREMYSRHLFKLVCDCLWCPLPCSLCWFWVAVRPNRAANGLWNVSKAGATQSVNVQSPAEPRRAAKPPPASPAKQAKREWGRHSFPLVCHKGHFCPVVAKLS